MQRVPQSLSVLLMTVTWEGARWSSRNPGQVCEQQKIRTMHMVMFALEEKERCNKYRRDSPWSFMLKPGIFSLTEVFYATSG